MTPAIVSAHEITIGDALLWSIALLGVLLIAALFDLALWKRLPLRVAQWMNNLTLVALTAALFWLLSRRAAFQINLFEQVSIRALLLAICIGFLFYLLLDRGLDTQIARWFPSGENRYRQALATLLRFPASSFFRVGLYAPLSEEIFMRGFLLGGLLSQYGSWIALLLSTAIFAALHFNEVQTLSAILCGLILGLLYLLTGSLLACVIAHALYNMVSFSALLLPRNK